MFDASVVPMVMVDHERRYLAANGAARLFLGLTLAELRARRIDDLTPQRDLPSLPVAWQQLMTLGAVTGSHPVGFADRATVTVSYCALANALPGQHLIVFMPARWPDDELGTTDEDDAPTPPSQVSRRELEVLTLIAGGATFNEIGRELMISHATVRSHVQNALRKLRARNRPHAVALAMQRGLIDPDALEPARDRSAAWPAAARW